MFVIEFDAPGQPGETSSEMEEGEHPPLEEERVTGGSPPFVTGLSVTVLVVAAVKFLVHLYANRHYGYFVDELYYIACGDHLDWGYVDQPPLVALIAKIVRSLFGDSLSAIRFLPALAGTVKVLLTGIIAHELGGQRFSQALAAVAILVAPGFLAIDNFLSMNSFEAVLWTSCALAIIRIIKTGNQKLWIWFGILAGIGLENKYSMLIFGAAITALRSNRQAQRQSPLGSFEPVHMWRIHVLGSRKLGNHPLRRCDPVRVAIGSIV